MQDYNEERGETDLLKEMGIAMTLVKIFLISNPLNLNVNVTSHYNRKLYITCQIITSKIPIYRKILIE